MNSKMLQLHVSRQHWAFFRGDILQLLAPGVEEMSTRESFNAKNDVAVPTWLLWLEHYLRVDSFRLGIYMRIFDGGLAWKWPNKSLWINIKQSFSGNRNKVYPEI